MITNILEYLEQSEKRYPDKIAFSDENTMCTYSQLLKTAKAVGSGLAQCVTPRMPVPVLMEKGVSAIYAFMGSVYAGCFYSLLNPKQPAHRIGQILDTLDANVLLTERKYQQQVETLDWSGNVLYIEELCEIAVCDKVLEGIRKQMLDVDPLYTIFTSGSTGIPKGVVVSHRSVIDFMECFTDLFHITEKDVIGNQAPFDFDVSVKDIYATLKTGATMQIIPKKLFSFPTKLLDYLVEREVTTLVWAVSALCMITTLKGFEYKVPHKINKVLFSGEVMPIKHLNIWREYLPNAMYVNLYGPTEITCNCTYYVIDREFQPGEVLPMGQAFPNEKILLLNEENQEVTKVGELGELCVSGTALSLGYYNNVEQTARVFVQNPLNQRYIEPIYRTGDLVYYDEKGQLCFASRKDFQIKHMGHRIELGEIEAAMEMLDTVIRACCIYDEAKNKIVAFYEGEIEKREISRHIGTLLPAFMIPNVFRKIESIPITENGKINRKMLKEQYLEDRA